MKEPRPQAIAPPQGSAPQLKVGVVLEEDRKKEISLLLPDSSFVLVAGDGEQVLEPKTACQVVCASEGLVFKQGADRVATSDGAALSLRPRDSLVLRPNSGIQVEGIVAGRSFHWRKDTKQSLPGELQFIQGAGGNIVMINSLPFEDYLACVISSEMSAQCPAEFVKAQATAARSWAHVFLQNKHPGAPFDICNDDDCQRYQGTGNLTDIAIEAVRQCSGMYVLSPDGSVCPTYYSKSCGGVMEGAAHAFGFDVPGLSVEVDGKQLETPELKDQSNFKAWIDDWSAEGGTIFCSPKVVSEAELPKYLGAVDEAGEYFRWEYKLSAEQIVSNMKKKYGEADVLSIQRVEFGARGTSGRFLSAVVVFTRLDGSEGRLVLENQYQIRRALHETFLFSSAFYVAQELREGEDIVELTLRGGGWGHGVGLCQIGALGMALIGEKYEEILRHYFPSCSLRKCY